MRFKRASVLHSSVSRSSINSLRLIDMKLDLVYSPEPTQTSTSFSRSPETTRMCPHEGRAATQPDVNGEQSGTVESSVAAMLAEDGDDHSHGDETEEVSQAMYDPDTDIPIYAV